MRSGARSGRISSGGKRRQPPSGNSTETITCISLRVTNFKEITDGSRDDGMEHGYLDGVQSYLLDSRHCRDRLAGGLGGAEGRGSGKQDGRIGHRDPKETVCPRRDLEGRVRGEKAGSGVEGAEILPWERIAYSS